jgi:mannose-6-phosphate isomerase-like protein (cupin superfamily)
MPGYAIKRIDDMEAVYAGAFKRARAELDVTAFGMQVIDMAPHVDAYPEHDHAGDGQEEVYIPLRGAGEIEIDGELHVLEPGMMVRVSPGTMRKVRTGDDRLRLLVVGGIPGKAYVAPASTELGAPDPLATRA